MYIRTLQTVSKDFKFLIRFIWNCCSNWTRSQTKKYLKLWEMTKFLWRILTICSLFIRGNRRLLIWLSELATSKTLQCMKNSLTSKEWQIKRLWNSDKNLIFKRSWGTSTRKQIKKKLILSLDKLICGSISWIQIWCG